VAEAKELLGICAEAARRGGAVLRERFGGARTVELKGGRDLVTDADRASEEVVLGFLAREAPGAAVLAEESGASGAAAGGIRFFVDPLDGTTNYAHGVPHFAVTVGAADGAGLAAGATLDPLRGELWTAARGAGAFLGEARVRCGDRADLRSALLATGFPADLHEEDGLPLRLFGAFVARSRAVRRFGAAALDLAWVASGRFDGFWEAKLAPWDLAAGVLIAREAGARVTDMDGGDAILETGDVVAAPPALAPRLLEVIAAARRARGP
jgi:myo-inositol-1(or 4)-monophosphatase